MHTYLAWNILRTRIFKFVQINSLGSQTATPLKGTHFYIGLYSKTFKHFSINHWSECINIWHVTLFSHSLIKEYIWYKPSERYRLEVDNISSFVYTPRVLSPFRGGGIAYLIDPDSYAGWSFYTPVRATQARQVEG